MFNDEVMKVRKCRVLLFLTLATVSSGYLLLPWPSRYPFFSKCDILVLAYQTIHLSVTSNSSILSIVCQCKKPFPWAWQWTAQAHAKQLFGESAVANESFWHLEASWRNVVHYNFNLVGDFLVAVLVLNVEHLLINFLHWHASYKILTNSGVFHVLDRQQPSCFASFCWVSSGTVEAVLLKNHRWWDMQM